MDIHKRFKFCLPYSIVPKIFTTAMLSAVLANAEPIMELEISNLKQPHNNIITAGQPSSAQLEALSNQGIQHVINLRVDNEIDWDEAALVAKLGMTYHHLPINGKPDINFKNASALSALINEVEDESTLLHCGSSNRVGALVALQSYKENGGDIEEAIIKGKAWGLTALEAHVRSYVSEAP